MAPPPRPVLIETGTVLAVTIDQPLSAKTNCSGDHFHALLGALVSVGDEEVLRGGTKALGTMTEGQQVSHLKGGAVSVLSLDSLAVNGTRYAVQGAATGEAGKGRRKRTTVGAGGGAALGTIVGAIARAGRVQRSALHQDLGLADQKPRSLEARTLQWLLRQGLSSG